MHARIEPHKNWQKKNNQSSHEDDDAFELIYDVWLTKSINKMNKAVHAVLSGVPDRRSPRKSAGNSLAERPRVVYTAASPKAPQTQMKALYIYIYSIYTHKRIGLESKRGKWARLGVSRVQHFPGPRLRVPLYATNKPGGLWSVKWSASDCGPCDFIVVC